MKQDVRKFGLYMLNRWSESEAMRAFAGAHCGWEYLWEKYMDIRRARGLSGAAMEFFFAIDGGLQQMLCDHIERTYDV